MATVPIKVETEENKMALSKSNGVFYAPPWPPRHFILAWKCGNWSKFDSEFVSHTLNQGLLLTFWQVILKCPSPRLSSNRMEIKSMIGRKLSCWKQLSNWIPATSCNQTTPNPKFTCTWRFRGVLCTQTYLEAMTTTYLRVLTLPQDWPHR